MDNLYSKHVLIKKNVNEIPKIEVFLGSNMNFTIRVFTWDLANDDNICEKSILSNLINNPINWNDTISNLWGQSNEKILQLTEQRIVPQNYKSYEITPIGFM